MNSSFYNILGLCRKANALSLGHDAVKVSLRNGDALGLFFCSDVSDRLKKELKTFVTDPDVKVIEINSSMLDIRNAIGFKAGVFTVNNEGLFRLLMNNI